MSSELFPETALATRTTGILSRAAADDSWLLSNVPKNFLMLPPRSGEGRGRRRVARTLLGDVLVVDDADDDSDGGGGGSAASS